MMKERIEKVKKFVKEHKKEIIIGGVSIVGTIMGVKLIGNAIHKWEYQNKLTDIYVEAYNRAAEISNEFLIPQINEKYKDYDFSLTDAFTQDIYKQYNDEYEREFGKIFEEQFNELLKLT